MSDNNELLPMNYTYVLFIIMHTTKQKQSLWLPLAWSCLPSEPALRHLCNTQVLGGKSSQGRTTGGSQVKVWETKLPSPAI